MWAWRYTCVQEAGNRRDEQQLGLDDACGGCRVWIYAICVYKCECKDLGEDGRLCTVLLGRAALLSWHKFVLGWWSSRQQGCSDACRGLRLCGKDYVQVCALVHARCTQQDRFLATPTVRPTGFVVNVGDQDC